MGQVRTEVVMILGAEGPAHIQSQMGRKQQPEHATDDLNAAGVKAADLANGAILLQLGHAKKLLHLGLALILRAREQLSITARDGVSVPWLVSRGEWG